jgi:hypothetical protein
MAAHILLPWIHRVFSLMKRWGLGTYHGLRFKHADRYLNEFVFRFNRRRYRHVSFEMILGLAARHPSGRVLGHHRPREPTQAPRAQAEESASTQDGIRDAERSPGHRPFAQLSLSITQAFDITVQTAVRQDRTDTSFGWDARWEE